MFKGYLYEAPAVHNLRLLVSFVNGMAKPIPWGVKEIWCGQVVAAIADVRASGFIVGALYNSGIGIRAGRMAMLDLSECAPRKLPTSRDQSPPKLLIPGADRCITPGSRLLNYQTDIFQLGYAV